MTVPKGKAFICCCFFLSFALIVPTLHAKIAKLDNFLKQRADEAKQAAEKAYNPHPEEVANSFNKQVGDLLTSNNTRRQLGGSQECAATNPIDRCWRCRADWHTDRKRLAGCAKGFGRKTIGGKLGEFYVVTDDSDDDVENPQPGTLRHAVIQEVPLWIVFSQSMVIKLQQELLITSNKTIDGRGVNVHIAYGAGLTIQFVENVIIHAFGFITLFQLLEELLGILFYILGLEPLATAMGSTYLDQATYGLTMFLWKDVMTASLMPSRDQRLLPSPIANSIIMTT